MFVFLSFDDAKIRCLHRRSKKKHFARLAKQDGAWQLFCLLAVCYSQCATRNFLHLCVNSIYVETRQVLTSANIVILRFVSKKRNTKFIPFFSITFLARFYCYYTLSACSIHEKLRIYLIGLIISDKSAFYVNNQGKSCF